MNKKETVASSQLNRVSTTKGVVMNKPNKQGEDKQIKPVKESNNPSRRDRQRGFGVIELLFAASTLASTVLIAAMNSSKKPPLEGD